VDIRYYRNYLHVKVGKYLIGDGIGDALPKCISDSRHNIIRAPEFMKYVHSAPRKHYSRERVVFLEHLIHLKSTYFGGKITYLTGLVMEAHNIGRYSINLRGSCQWWVWEYRVLG